MEQAEVKTMTPERQETYTLRLKTGELLFAAGEENHDLYFVQSGKLLAFVNDGTRITPLAYIKKEHYIGEMSFFDGMPCSANVVCLEDTVLLRICFDHLEQECPRWLITIAANISSKLRKAGELIRQKGIRRKNTQAVAPLSIEEQRYYYQVLTEHREKYPEGRRF